MSSEWGTQSGAFARNSLLGQVFGKLTVQRELPHKKPGAREWLCKCECGNTKTVKSGNLKNGSTKSCGCLETHARKQPFEWLYNKLKWCSKRQGWALEISFEDFIAYTVVSECHYCGATVTWSPYASVHGKQTSRAYNLDRKDTNDGYRKTNVVVCCARCNYSKADRFTYEDWLKIGALIRTFAQT
jgi:hypothetical protein